MSLTEKIVADYIQCALWASSFDDNEEGPMELSAKARAVLTLQAEVFAHNYPNLCETWEKLGHSVGNDLWLTRNHHGAGFWSRTTPASSSIGWGTFKKVQDVLNEQARAAGEVDLVAGDDGKIYIA